MPTLPVLTTERLTLRPFTIGDAADVQRLAGVREVADTTMHIPHPYPDGLAKQWIETHAPAWEARTGATYAVVESASNGLVGAAGLTLAMEHERAEVGYWIGVSFWNRGYATEVTRVLIAFAFDALGLHRVQARHLSRNPASGRVMQKAGMRLEGTHREQMKRWGRFEDIVMYGILASDRAAP